MSDNDIAQVRVINERLFTVPAPPGAMLVRAGWAHYEGGNESEFAPWVEPVTASVYGATFGADGDLHPERFTWYGYATADENRLLQWQHVRVHQGPPRCFEVAVAVWPDAPVTEG